MDQSLCPPGIVRTRAISGPMVARGLVLAAYVGYAVAKLVIPGDFVVLRDAWLCNTVLLATGILGFVTVRPGDPGRHGLRVLAGGSLVWSIGNVVWTLWVRPLDPEPFPSAADGLWLLFYPIVCIGIVLLVRSQAPRIRLGMLLDGLIGGCAMAAVAAAFVFDRIAENASGGRMAVLVNLAYPVGDLVLILLVIASGVIAGQPSRRWFALLVGLGTFAVGDSVYLAQVADGTYQGGIIDLSWVTGMVALSFLPVLPARRRPHRPDPRWTLGLPLGFASAALVVIVVHNLLKTSDLSLYLAVAALAASVPRLVLAGRDASMLAHVTRIAASDELTGLSNRRAFFDSFQEMATARGDELLATMLIDLDGFKQVNDTYGHSTGDEVLRVVSLRFRGALRGADLLARLGGDEFGVVARCADLAEAEALARRLVTSLDEPIGTDRATFALRASIGIALSPQHGTDLDELVAHADEAMYEAKRDGGSPRVFTPRSPTLAAATASGVSVR